MSEAAVAIDTKSIEWTRVQRPRKHRRVIKSDSAEPIYSRQKPDDDTFRNFLGESQLAVPPYNFANLYLIYERSDVLRWCVSAMKQNVVGFGYSLKFLGQDRLEDTGDEADKAGQIKKTDPVAVAQKYKVLNFFRKVNEKGHTFGTIAKKAWEDYEVTGNAAFEVVRNAQGEIVSLYHIPVKYIRKSLLPKKPVFADVEFVRDGETVTVPRRRYFRYFVQQSSSGIEPIYYKEFGDSRHMNSITGRYHTPEEIVKLKAQNNPDLPAYDEASEILWIQQDMGGLTYGIPRWIGSLMAVLGRQSINSINYKLTEKGGIPPFIVFVSGGTLTEESLGDLMEAMDSWETDGADTWVRGVVLESTPETTGLEDKGNAKIDIKFLSDSRQNDLMFKDYGKNCLDDTRMCFRIAPLYYGGTEDYNRATAISAIRVTEQQAFQPERESFDEMVSAMILVEGLGVYLWEYKSNGPRIVGDEEFRLGFQAFAQYGAVTINQSIEMANAAFGLEMSKYDADWANYPFSMVVELIRQNKLSGLDAIAKPDMPAPDFSSINPAADNPNPGGGLNPRPVFPVPVAPATKDDNGNGLDAAAFTPEQMDLYNALKVIDAFVRQIQAPHEITDHEISI